MRSALRSHARRFALPLALLACTVSTARAAVRVTNQTDSMFTVAWTTPGPDVCRVEYGPTPSLGWTADDERGPAASECTHHVRLTGLAASSSYYFDTVCQTAGRDDNGGAHHKGQTGPALGVRMPDTVYGMVFRADGVSCAEGSIVFITVEDGDDLGSPGSSAVLSSLVSSCYWSTNLDRARTTTLTSYFDYSAGGGDRTFQDIVSCDSAGSYWVPTNGDSPSPPIVLQPCAAPPLTEGLSFRDRNALEWTPTSASAYDVVRGDLGVLRNGAGDFAGSIQACVENDSPDAFSSDPSLPDPAQGFYYLVRGVGCGRNGSYDGGDPSQQGPRDGGIAASPLSCP